MPEKLIMIDYISLSDDEQSKAFYPIHRQIFLHKQINHQRVYAVCN